MILRDLTPSPPYLVYINPHNTLVSQPFRAGQNVVAPFMSRKNPDRLGKVSFAGRESVTDELGIRSFCCA
ncbi:protein of unknown function [Methylocaldum szegediense]|uniref:Uncharacterized protein n=1 Tax=Methylocaldum szegediense TaxID=73780 RepID=A0ABM9I2E5_9GAMM|nr:protein of unknown function [Methylocaldum szegediense]